MTVKLDDNFILGSPSDAYIVAEINTSHFGDIELAKTMIDKAKQAGCNCVKFQSWSGDTLYSKEFYAKNPIAKRIISKFSLSDQSLKDISNYCNSTGISFASTPYSRDEVDFLASECNVPYIKIASMDLTNYSFVEYIGRTGKPIVLSTGMGDLNEIRHAIDVISRTGNYKICILHCVSLYPTPPNLLRLNNIIGLKNEFPNFPVGFSDHSLGIEMAPAAIALGACMIEKHFTLDKSKIGMDNQMAIEPDEMGKMIQNCKNVKQALGEYNRIISKEEIEQKIKMRRSVVAARSLKAGHVIGHEDLDVKRPGTGIPPEEILSIIGMKLIKDIDKDACIKKQDIA
jgi:N-acetylneuraminate synthase